VVLDTLEALFSGLPNQAILRTELRRLFRRLKDRGMTAVIAGEQIIAAPALIKKLLRPLRRFIGDMSQTERILLGLDLRKA
jgi:hypothetical protein